MNGIIKIGLCSITMLVILLIGSFESHAARPDSLVFSLHFRRGDAMLMKNYRENESTLNAMAAALTKDGDSICLKINIFGSSSPDGGSEYNNGLAQKRAEAVRGYIRWQYGLSDRRIFEITTSPDPLIAWIRAVEEDMNVPQREEVLEILNSDVAIETKRAKIQLLTGENSQYMAMQILPTLRNAVACIITINDQESASSQETYQPEDIEIVCDTTTSATIAPIATIATIAPIAPSAPIAIENQPETTVDNNPEFTPDKPLKANKQLFALKTNLLFDAATILNLEIEVPIGKQWSIAGEIIFPWWLWENKQNCIQVFSGIIEGRYWFGGRINRPDMTGWFAGVHMGGGYYDLELNRKGYQGEFFLAAGVSGGYAHTINKKGNLRMEYSLGVGYLSTNYRSYEAKFSDVDNSWHLYRKESGRFSWFGPTRAKISLVWMLDTNLFKKRGGRR